MGGGTLTLQEGGGLGSSGDGQIDLSNSTLELAGPFLNDGGTLTTSASTLKLKANVLFRLGNVVTFNTYVPNGWGLLLYNNQNTGTVKSLTLGTNNSNITIEPSTNSLTSGFVSWYHDDNTEYVSGDHYIGIESNNGSLTINGNLTLKDNATITSNYGELELGNLTLENGNIVANKATLSLAGGTIGTNGQINVRNESELELQGGLSVAGILNLDDESIFKLAGNTLELSGGKFSTDDDLSLAGTLSIAGDSELTVSQGHTLTLSQAGGLALGANTLTLSGGGSLVSGGVTLNNADSKLLLNSITVDSVSTSLANSGLDVDDDSTVTSLSVGHTTPVSIDTGKTLSGAITAVSYTHLTLPTNREV